MPLQRIQQYYKQKPPELLEARELTGWRVPFAIGRVVTKTWAS